MGRAFASRRTIAPTTVGRVRVRSRRVSSSCSIRRRARSEPRGACGARGHGNDRTTPDRAGVRPGSPPSRRAPRVHGSHARSPSATPPPRPAVGPTGKRCRGERETMGSGVRHCVSVSREAACWQPHPLASDPYGGGRAGIVGTGAARANTMRVQPTARNLRGPARTTVWRRPRRLSRRYVPRRRVGQSNRTSVSPWWSSDTASSR